ncbi:hypothetical protein JOM56_006669 [Amanita muscaria]
MTPLLLLLLLAALAFGNTEVVKYTISDSLPSLPVPSPDSRWPVLCQSHQDKKFNITPALSSSVCTEDDQKCLHRLWTVLDTTGTKWSSYSTYMLRISWPAHFPTKFSINIYESPSGNPRLRYARIDAIVEAVHTPPSDGIYPFLPHHTSTTTSEEKWEPVPFYLDLEPLYLGFLPESMIPVAICIVVISIFVYKFIVPLIDRYLQTLAEQARRELTSNGFKRKN